MKSAALLLAACVTFLPAVSANAGEPPETVRLFQFAANDDLAAFVDFPSLQANGATRSGWTYLVFAEPRRDDTFAQSIGSYWEAFAGDCDGHVVHSLGLKLLDTFSNELFSTVGDEDAKITRQAGEGSFDAYLLAMVCGGNEEPTDQQPFATASDAYFKAFK
jgi:hypothetical protein